MAQSRLAQIKQRYRLTRADIVVDESKKGKTVFHAELEINPIAKSNKAGEMDFIDPPISCIAAPPPPKSHAWIPPCENAPLGPCSTRRAAPPVHGRKKSLGPSVGALSTEASHTA